MSVSELIRKSWSKNDPTGWFDAVYARARSGQAHVPWAFMQPHPDLITWLDQNPGVRGQAVVIGCGLGDDAEELARRGFAVTAFDISQTAVDWCNERFPDSPVDYQQADLFDLPPDWQNRFDFVLESRTVQALPYPMSDNAIQHIAGLTAPGGAILVLCHGREPEDDYHGIPWPLSRRELAAFERSGLIEIDFEDYTRNGHRRFRVTYRKEK